MGGQAGRGEDEQTFDEKDRGEHETSLRLRLHKDDKSKTLRTSRPGEGNVTGVSRTLPIFKAESKPSTEICDLHGESVS